jgi:diguanylate cyclase (GGDEF)-like protein/PAS domain S-box-containing protein
MNKTFSRLTQYTESSLRILLQTLPDLIWLKDTEGVYLACNQRFEKFFGKLEDEIVGRTDYDFVDKELADSFRKHDQIAMAKQAPSVNEEWVTFADDGHRELLETTKAPLRDAEGHLIGILGVGHNITRRKQAEHYEQFRNSTLELLTGESPLDVVLDFIVRGVEQLNPAMLCSILLLDSEGKHLGKGIAPSLPDFYNAAIDGIEIGLGVGSCGEAAFTGERVIVEDITTHPNWAPFSELASRAKLGACWSQPILSSSRQVLGTFAIYHKDKHAPTDSDIYIIEQSARLVSIAIERKQMEDEVRKLAFYDALTELPNRRLLTDRLKQALTTSKRKGLYGALLFLDLDNFKPLNDQHGHDFGDLLLKEAARRIRSCVREVDTVARFGGDEFVVVLSELVADKTASATQVSMVAEKIRAALAAPYLLSIRKDDSVETSVEHHCTSSIGAVLFGNQESSASDILKWADLAMYQAKAAGRNTVKFYDA